MQRKKSIEEKHCFVKAMRFSFLVGIIERHSLDNESSFEEARRQNHLHTHTWRWSWTRVGFLSSRSVQSYFGARRLRALLSVGGESGTQFATRGRRRLDPKEQN